MFTPFGTTPMPCGVDENFVGLAAINDLGIARHELHAGVVGGGAHRLHDAPEILHRHSFLQDESDREIKRARAAHREVVNRSVDREFADVTAGKKIGLTT